jgi:hypothetical protein
MSKLFYEELLSKFKKSNKSRKLKISLQSGFDTTEQYIDFLESNINGTNSFTEESVLEDEIPTILVMDVVDRSGSMAGPKLNAANKGIQAGLEELKTDTNANYLHGIIDFGSDVKNHSVQQVTSKTTISRIFSSGLTALHDAVAIAILTSVSKAPQDKILINVYTDGGENASKNYNRNGDSRNKNGLSIKDLIAKHKEQVTVTFIGTATDVSNAQRYYDLGDGNSLIYDGSAKGLEITLTATKTARQTYSSKVKRGENVSQGFYKDVN